jgi:hypothetical protein
MQRLAIRFTPCAPIDTAEVEQWLEDAVVQFRARAPHAVLRLLSLTQTVPTGEIGIGWLLEIDTTCGDEPLNEGVLGSVLRDARLLGLQPTVLRAQVIRDAPPLRSADVHLNAGTA